MYVTECGELKSLPCSIYQMTNLQKLDLSECTGLERIPEKVASPDNVENLNDGGWTMLPRISEAFGWLTTHLLVHQAIGISDQPPTARPDWVFQFDKAS